MKIIVITMPDSCPDEVVFETRDLIDGWLNRSAPPEPIMVDVEERDDAE